MMSGFVMRDRLAQPTYGRSPPPGERPLLSALSKVETALMPRRLRAAARLSPRSIPDAEAS